MRSPLPTIAGEGVQNRLSARRLTMTITGNPGGRVSETVSRPEAGSAPFFSDPPIPSMWDEDPAWPGPSSGPRDGNAKLEVVSDQGITMPCGLDREGLLAAAELLFRDHSYCGEVLVVLTDDDAVRDLNNRYRGIDRSTDVLSFDLSDDDGVAGEVYVSLPTAERQAASYCADTATEVCRLAVHGMLHLAGHDDQTEEDEAEMARETEHYLRSMESIGAVRECDSRSDRGRDRCPVEAMAGGDSREAAAGTSVRACPVRSESGSGGSFTADSSVRRVAGGFAGCDTSPSSKASAAGGCSGYRAGRDSSPPPEAAARGGLCACPAGCPEEVNS